MQFIDLKAQYQHLKHKINARIQTVLDHGQYIMGPEVQEFEERLAEYVGVNHAITCANGTDALQLALKAMKIGPGDAVFCPTFTFFASAEAIAFVGATPIFVDSDEDTFNICLNDLEKRIKSTLAEGKVILKAIMAVDLFGLPANYAEIQKIAEKYNLKVIEDAAQGFGGSIKSQKAGSFGDIATTSFFPAKPLGCYGDGGAIFTNNDDYAELIRSYRIHGKGAHKYDNIRIGMNSRLDTIQAAILLEKLYIFDEELIARQKIAEAYNREFYSYINDLITPIIPDGYTSSWAQYTLRSFNRNTHMKSLQKANVPSVIYYGKCMHEQTAFKENKGVAEYPKAEKLIQSVFSLPMHPYIDSESVKKITSSLKVS